mmetsp:Transcript_645/g.2697  ORF Transcript_645/g.2697 Transcript_645/m.2697 type:complete len:292 (+) Transcript_645:1807-2682(+)
MVSEKRQQISNGPLNNLGKNGLVVNAEQASAGLLVGILLATPFAFLAGVLLVVVVVVVVCARLFLVLNRSDSSVENIQGRLARGPGILGGGLDTLQSFAREYLGLRASSLALHVFALKTFIVIAADLLLIVVWSLEVEQRLILLDQELVKLWVFFLDCLELLLVPGTGIRPELLVVQLLDDAAHGTLVLAVVVADVVEGAGAALVVAVLIIWSDQVAGVVILVAHARKEGVHGLDLAQIIVAFGLPTGLPSGRSCLPLRGLEIFTTLDLLGKLDLVFRLGTNSGAGFREVL